MPEKILRGFFNILTIWREKFQLEFEDPEKWSNFNFRWVHAEISDLDNFGFFTLFTGVCLSHAECTCEARIQKKHMKVHLSYTTS